ncbi:hypothetical protein BDW60DRAFT_224989 [Aspergillus nidulans var. acristatus]
MGSFSISEEQFTATLQKYATEAQKRRRPDGTAQYADIALSAQFKHFSEDPWIRGDENQRQNPYLSQPNPVPKNGGHTKVLVTGAGFGALLYAFRLMQTGAFKAEDFVFVDSAWGFGGTWYWNRYPGLMCDVESSCYMPLLEETGYIPKHRYSYGPELRSYAELVARKYGFHTRAVFGSTVKECVWDEERSEWVTTAIQKNPTTRTEATLSIRSDFVVLASGILNRPKLPRLAGLDTYRGHMFHTSRWDYEYTGGSPEDPTLSRLRGKKVAFIGTGATGIQVVPELAKWAERLYVFQRTPSSVDVRGQRAIDPEEWRRDITKEGREGWQRERRENFALFCSNAPDLPRENLVDDAWTHYPTNSALVGGPRAAEVTAQNVEGYVEGLHRLDIVRQERIRQRVESVVKDPATAEGLKAWYPGWCKRPCFHDEYLAAFNEPNVTLVDTDGKGIDGFSTAGVRHAGKDYQVDVVILGTGFESFTAGSPSFRARIEIKGRGGESLDEKWKRGAGTLHGVFTHGFPNLLLTGLTQAGGAVNVVHVMDVLASHGAKIIQAAQQEVGSYQKVLIEPTFEAEEAWSMAVASNAYAYAAIPDCTPSYATLEGSRMAAETPEDEIRLARSLSWGRGICDFIEILAAWETDNRLSDLRISAA